MLELWAAIDILSGDVVTLKQGKESMKTSWKQSPLDYSSRWEKEGAHGLHIIDLDAAFGRGSNRGLIEKIARRSGIPVEVGGGVRTQEIADELLSIGAERVVVGTVAYSHPEILRSLLKKYGPRRIVVAADYRDGMVVTRGWTAEQGVSVLDASKEMEAMGVENLLATAVSQDGMGTGPDLDTLGLLCKDTGLRVLASGGIRDVEDLARIQGQGAAGAIIGRALYDGGIELQEAKRRLGEALR
jgi:phosphoribosylformimino-5-aminoimidazole carboxamide ribotide isomerase